MCLGAQHGVSSQLYADNLKCVCRDPGLLLRAARFTTGCVRPVGQEPAPGECECVLLSTSKVVRGDMRNWVLSEEGDKWTVKMNVRDVEGRGWSSTLSARDRLVISRHALIFALPLDFYGRVRVVRTMFIPCALHGVEASFLSKGSFLKLRAAVLRAVWSGRQPKLLLVLFWACWMDLRAVILPFAWSGFLLEKMRGEAVLAGSLIEIRENPEVHDLMRMDKSHWPRCLLWHGWLPLLSGANSASPWAATPGELL